MAGIISLPALTTGSKDKTGESAYSDFCGEGSTAVSDMVTLDNGVSLRRVKFIPMNPGRLPEILFLPGLASVMENFSGVLSALNSRFTVHFLETREKKSSIVPEGAGFGVHDIASDISGAINTIFRNGEKYIILGYSLGATAAAEAMPSVINKPRLLILTEPSATFRFPPFSLFLARYFVPLYYPLRPFLKWYMRKFHINIKEDYDMYVINSRIIDSASPRKIAATIRAISEYHIDDSLEHVDVPVVVIGASKDLFHSHDEALSIASAIKGCQYVEMENNKRTHSRELAEWLLDQPCISPQEN